MIFSKWVFRQTILAIILNQNSLNTSTYSEKKISEKQSITDPDFYYSHQVPGSKK